MSDYDPNLVADEASADLRRGLGGTRELAIEARHRLSELTSQTVYSGPAEFILADANAQSQALTSDQAGHRSPPDTTS